VSARHQEYAGESSITSRRSFGSPPLMEATNVSTARTERDQHPFCANIDDLYILLAEAERLLFVSYPSDPAARP
jgi:hypothetical protein